VNIQDLKRPRQRGNALLIALILSALLGVTLASCLLLVSGQNASVVRSQSWNGSLALAEAGVEEALAEMNTPGWALGEYAPVTRTLSQGSYTFSITTNPAPTIYSTGSVTVASMFAAVNVPNPSTTVSRAVQVGVKQLPLINAAFAARYSIQMNGSDPGTNVTSDSFNSHDPSLSTNGQYDQHKARNHGDVASVYGPVNFGGHRIAGNLFLGSGAAYNSGTGQVLGKIYYDFNVDYPSAVLPETLWHNAPWENIKVGNQMVKYYHFTTSGDYTVSDSTPILVDPNVTVRLKVTDPNFCPGDVHVLGGLTDSGTLIVYHVSGSASLSGNTTVDSLRAENFWYFGLPGVTSITFGGTTCNIGVIYAPSADLTLNGGGNNNGLIGSSISKTIAMNGHFDFHYDEALGLLGPARGYVPISWQEL
jgi:hypothetical protein